MGDNCEKGKNKREWEESNLDGIWAGSGTKLGTAEKGEGEQRSLREGEMQLGLGETEEEKWRGKKDSGLGDRRVREFWTPSSLDAGQEWSSHPSLCPRLAEPWPSSLLIISKNSNETREIETEPIIRAANEISQSKEIRRKLRRKGFCKPCDTEINIYIALLLKILEDFGSLKIHTAGYLHLIK